MSITQARPEVPPGDVYEETPEGVSGVPEPVSETPAVVSGARLERDGETGATGVGGPPAGRSGAVVSETPEGVSGAPSAVSETAPAASGAGRDRSRTALQWGGGIGGAIVGAIGFSGSYGALRDLAERKGFGEFARFFPIGIDAGIVALLALDLWLVRAGRPWPALRWIAHLMTLATIYFNASAGEHTIREDPTAAAMHAAMPLLFVAVVEAFRRRLLHGDDRPEGVPLYRWLLAPWRTWRLYRQMRLYGLTSYGASVGRQQELDVHRAMLEREHGAATRKRVPQDQWDLLLPLELARYGLSVQEALELPARAAEDARRRREAAAERERLEREAAAERETAEEIAAAERAAAREEARLAADGRVQAAQAAQAAQAGQAEVAARSQVAAAERAATAEVAAAEAAAQAAAQAAGAADVAQAEARREMAAREAAEARRAAAETARAAAETEQAAAEKAQSAAEIAARAARLERDRELDQKAAAEARRAAAEAERDAAEARRDAAEIELRAARLEDAARLSPRERTVRRVARLILTEAGGAPEGLPLERIAQETGVSSSATASEYRREAAALLDSGYQPGEDA
ncbi:Protein of unknown function [Streptomyces zhaozhouensis]|uniref:DUF2637 domain-containing protein n=1 Tax=Streptomyces zhaozhouensis TaxID=1300267 RepID=A0A286E9A7_9ACTN|nr:DUF2637 domain-containing protein [Streptomyces zhaozhouensis]SOD67473.1 Protein of unknown function [Streptomyces zhaozhouensis]